jgi:hypothetical protein
MSPSSSSWSSSRSFACKSEFALAMVEFRAENAECGGQVVRVYEEARGGSKHVKMLLELRGATLCNEA